MVMLSVSIRFSFAWNVCTARSASPFDAGWNEADVMWVMLFLLQKFQNCSLVKQDPLSEASVSGTPRVANISRKPSMVASEVAV